MKLNRRKLLVTGASASATAAATVRSQAADSALNPQPSTHNSPLKYSVGGRINRNEGALCGQTASCRTKPERVAFPA